MNKVELNWTGSFTASSLASEVINKADLHKCVFQLRMWDESLQTHLALMYQRNVEFGFKRYNYWIFNEKEKSLNKVGETGIKLKWEKTQPELTLQRITF